MENAQFIEGPLEVNTYVGSDMQIRAALRFSIGPDEFLMADLGDATDIAKMMISLVGLGRDLAQSQVEIDAALEKGDSIEDVTLLLAQRQSAPLN